MPKTKLLFSAFLLLLAAASCKKKTDITPEGSEEELIRDSIFLYAKEVYYWYDALPERSVFNPRKYTSYPTALENYENELFAITQYKINPKTSLPYEFVSPTAGYPKYSYISDITEQNAIAYVRNRKSSLDLNDIGNDYGLKVNFYGSYSNYRLYVQAVYPNSPAEKAGLKRGDIINNINGRVMGSNFDSEYDHFYEAIFNSNTVTLGGKRRDETAFSNLKLNKVTYTSSPILKDTVYIDNGAKIGYINYARFSTPTNSVAHFNRIFDEFASAPNQITDLIVDLRYNGGGYVSTAEHLINLIAPSSVGNSVMFTEYYNALMQQNYAARKTKAPLLAKQYIYDANDNKQDSNGDGKWDTYADVDFSAENQQTRFAKKGALGSIRRVVFIVSGSTASASELVINSLKPHMEVKVVGSKSYGKPIGFFPIRINKYDVYYSMFESKNSSGNGGYFDGIDPDVTSNDMADKGDNYDMWDTRDYCLKAAINIIKANSVKSAPDKVSASAGVSRPLSAPGKNVEDLDFKGMIETRFKVK